MNSQEAKAEIERIKPIITWARKAPLQEVAEKYPKAYRGNMARWGRSNVIESLKGRITWLNIIASRPN